MPEDKKSGYGIASLVLGISGLIIPFVGVVCSILAIIFYVIQKKHKPMRIATAGLILGIIGIALTVLLLVLVFAGILWAVSTGISGDYELNDFNLTVEDLRCEYVDYGVIAKGRIRNNGDFEAEYVQANVDLYNDGEWADSGYSYLRNTDLPAGEIDSFEISFFDESLEFTDCEAYATLN